jgi:chromosome segregation ATPase
MSHDYGQLRDIKMELVEISRKLDNLYDSIEQVITEVREVNNNISRLRARIDAHFRDVMSALSALSSAVAELRRYVEEQFMELRELAERYRKEFLEEHRKRHREAVALSVHQQDFLTHLDMAVVGLRQRMEEVSLALEEVEEATKRAGALLYELELCKALEVEKILYSA